MTDPAPEPIPPTRRAASPEETAQRFHALVERHYVPLYQLAAARLGEAGAARPAVVRTLAAAWGQLTRHPAREGDAWLYELALRQAPRRPAAAGQAADLPTGEAAFWKAAAALDEQEHLLLVLRYALGWSEAQSARLLRVGEGAVKAQLRLFRQQLAARLPAVQPPMPPDEALQAALQRRYPAPAVTPEFLSDIAAQARQLAERPQAPQAAPGPASAIPAAQAGRNTGWLLAAGGAVLVLMCLFAGLSGWGLAASGLLGGRPTQRDERVNSNLPTPITPAPRLAELSRYSSRDEILQRWQDSPGLWRTLALDVQLADYGPLSYIGPPRRYRLGAWVSQPGEAFELFGLLAGPPTQILLTTGNQQYRRDLLNGQTTHTTWDGYAATQLSQPHLRWMAYPSSSPWAERPGAFRAVQHSTYLERPVVIYDWLNLDGQREARLWLDARTGIILRLQEYGGPAFETLVSESAATLASFDAAAPPVALSTAARAYAQPEPALEFQDLQPTPTPAAAPQPRPTLAPESAPPGFDPQGAQLAFALSQTAHPLDDYAQGPTNRFELFADGYWLGTLRFGLPWGLRCTRSPNGLYLAYSSASEGTFPADDTLRWLDLRQPERVYQTEARLAATAFAFSPQNDRLAAFSPQGYGDQPPGIFIVHPITGEVRSLIAAERAENLAWSPDGEYLAFQGRRPGDEADSLIVAHVRTGTVNYQSEPGQPLDLAVNESPLLLWGIEYPQGVGGLDACARP